MDPFTEKLLERTRARRENLQKKMAERPTSASRQMTKRVREPLAVTPANSEGSEALFDHASVLPSTKPSPSKRRCSDDKELAKAEVENREPIVEAQMVQKPPPGPVSAPAVCPAPFPERIRVPEQQQEPPALPQEAEHTPYGMRSRLQKLAEMRQYWDSDAPCEPISSPVKPQIQELLPPSPAPMPTVATVGRRGRLANLAATINSWEDDLGHQPPRQDNAQVQPGTACTPRTGRTAVSQPGLPKEQLLSSPVKPISVAQVSPQKKDPPLSASSPLKICTPQPPSASNSSPQKPVPKHSPRKPEPGPGREATPLHHKGPASTPVGQGVKSFLERFGERCQERSVHNSPSAPKVTSGSHALTPNNRLVQERLRTPQTKTATADLTQKQKLERENELAQIRSRFQKGNMWKGNQDAETKVAVPPPKPEVVPVQQPKVEPGAPPAESFSPKSTGCEVASPLDCSTLKRDKIALKTVEEDTTQKDGDAREVEMSVDDINSSDVINKLFHDVLGESTEREVHEEESEGEEEEDGLNISSMSLLAPLAETVAAVAKSPEIKIMTSTPASSFCEKNQTPDRVGKFQKTRMRRSRSTGSLDVAEDEQNLPYSIDAYRSTRIKDTAERPHVKQVIVRKEDVSQRTQEIPHNSHISAKQKIRELTNEMNLQQTVIHQASQALNCCTDEEHGKGSQVEAEAERLLLVATEKRVALKAELDRLKGDGPSARKKGSSSSRANDDLGVAASKGSISLLELRLPLKADFVCSEANKPGSANYYFFIMIRSGPDNMVATPLANTRSALSGDALTFSTTFTLGNVSNDFEIDIEVYCLVQKRELLAEKRKKASKSKAITPKRLLTSITKSTLQTPVMASPGGPNAVRTSNFSLVGSHKITLTSIGKNKFPLEKMSFDGSERELLGEMFQSKVPFLCPLEGHIYLKLHCEVGSLVEERGFLTMFEDVSGFGAWHRRWCVLSGYCISYWTYPDDEKRKNPIGRVNLANCTSRKVEPANREFCARPNTFELITVRPQRDDDKETLVSQCRNTMCVTKNWLSADTKEERNLWMQKLNQILVDLRMWQPDSCYRPI